VDESSMEEVQSHTLKHYKSYPVFLNTKMMDKFYHGFCNSTIWPLFHYFLSQAVFDESYWNHYKRVNEIFCDAIVKVMKPGDIVWIQDYHLMLLPKLLHDRNADVPIGYFHHIPFPSFEIFRMLPSKWRREILEGLAGSNLVGFHTHSFTQYFLRCVLRVLGNENKLGEIVLGDHRLKAAPFPIGVDYKNFQLTAKGPKVKSEMRRFKKILSHRKTVLSVDRLDYTKGVSNRLEGFDQFLRKNPDYHGKVVLVLVVVPSRIGVEDYQKMKKRIDEMVGRINGKYGSVDWTPVNYQYSFLTFETLVALYRLSDVALITPLRDGMNLVAKEYLASRLDNTGVLILSERAGAAKELGEAILINPSYRDEIADSIKTALEVPKQDQIRANKAMRERLKRYDIIRWADDFLSTVLEMKKKQEKWSVRKLDVETRSLPLLKDFKKAKRRLLLLDYDGTLTSFVKDPKKAFPSKEISLLLKKLTELPRTDVVLISGRDQKTLVKWFGKLPIGIVAEHGAAMRGFRSKTFSRKEGPQDWKPGIRAIFKVYCERLVHSFIEEKKFSLAWHYRASDTEQGDNFARDLIDELVNFTANINLQVLRGSKVVEVRMAGVNKGNAALTFISKQKYDFVLSIGDDWTDEDIFEVLPSDAHSIKVGLTPSAARFNVAGISDVHKLLNRMVQTR